MNIEEAIRARHSVRSFTDKPIEPEKLQALRQAVEEANAEGHLHIQLVDNDPAAFDSRLAHYGKFSGVSHYFALIGPRSADLEEKLGYYGERLVLKAQMLGLNTCWVGLTYKKNPARIQMGDDEKMTCVIAFGYGTTQGLPHKVKPLEKVARAKGPLPDWFRRGAELALLAPTALNQQKFSFVLHDGNRVEAKAGWGFFTKTDLGIVKCHFEIGAGTDRFVWL